MPLKCSLFEEIALLIEPEEMATCLALLPEKQIIDASRPLTTFILPTIDFLAAYTNYIAQLKRGELIDPKEAFHGKIIINPNCYHLEPVAEDRFIIDFDRPSISMKHTTAILSSEGTLRLHMFGKDKLFLGITLQYPRIYEGVDRIARKTTDLPEFKAFRLLAQYARQHTFPLKFQGKPIEVRVSEASHKWITRQGIFS